MSGKKSNWLIPSIPTIIYICILFILCGKVGQVLLRDGDTGYHIRAGEFILDHLSLPTLDIYSYITPQLNWTMHEWLAEVIMACIYRVGGLTGIVVFFAMLIAGTYAIFCRLLSRHGINILLAAFTTVLVFKASLIHWLARPHIFSALIMVIWYYILDNFQYHNHNRLAALPLLMLLWVNLHGGFIIGFVLLGIYLIGDFLNCHFNGQDASSWYRNKGRLYLRTILLCCATAVINPFTWRIFLFPFSIDSLLLDRVTEFLSPDFHYEIVFKFLLLGMLALVAIVPKRFHPIELFILLFFTNMGLQAYRFIPLYAMFVFPILARRCDASLLASFPRISSFLERQGSIAATMDRQSRGIVHFIVVSLLVVVLSWQGTIHFTFDPQFLPVTAIEFLVKEPVKGNMFNNDAFGDLLIFMAHNRYKVFIDGRLDMYGSRHVKVYDTIMSFEPGWEAVLARYGITWFFITTNTPLARHLAVLPSWHLIYSDKVASIFLKNGPEYQTLIDKYPHVQLAQIKSDQDS